MFQNVRSIVSVARSNVTARHQPNGAEYETKEPPGFLLCIRQNISTKGNAQTRNQQWNLPLSVNYDTKSFRRASTAVRHYREGALRRDRLKW